MKAILEFDLPDDQEEFEIANRAMDYHSALWDIDQHMRTCLKHGHTYKTIEEVMEHIRTMMPEL